MITRDATRSCRVETHNWYPATHIAADEGASSSLSSVGPCGIPVAALSNCQASSDDSSASFAIRGQLGGWSRFTYLVSTLDTNESDHRTELQVDRPVEHDPGRADRVDQLLDPADCDVDDRHPRGPLADLYAGPSRRRWRLTHGQLERDHHRCVPGRPA